ncbi:MAG: quinone oxidoreductase [Candidatus Lambdaproteobacteria bacterium]|nr:quinone oxidoreductase [Candidatus Lambdaproteobacteria bacterium]
MRAVRVHTPGGPECLVYEELPTPEPAPGQVLVKLAAAGVNFREIHQRQGMLQEPLPLIPGREGAGTVVELGRGVASHKVGEQVVYYGGYGSYAEYVALPAERAVKLPAGIDARTAASVMLQGMTAHYLTHDSWPLKRGERCLIHAGAGGTGLLAIQMAKHAGAEVFTTVSTEEKAALCRRMGADHAILYTRVDFAEEVNRIAGPRKIDVIYDGVCGTTFLKGFDVLRPRGLNVVFGRSAGAAPPFDLALLAAKGSLYMQYGSLRDHSATPEDLRRRAEDVFRMVREGWLKVHLWQTFPLAQAREAQQALQERRTTGKLLLIP